jgi:hypothetical protein
MQVMHVAWNPKAAMKSCTKSCADASPPEDDSNSLALNTRCWITVKATVAPSTHQARQLSQCVNAA